MLAVIDYGAGNLRSVANALTFLEIPYNICTSPASLADASRMLLPGVGHFGAAMTALNESGLAKSIIEKTNAGTPLSGICLGLQLLFETSEEAPGVKGLGLIEGTVRTLKTRRIPHMGWNRVIPVASSGDCSNPVGADLCVCPDSVGATGGRPGTDNTLDSDPVGADLCVCPDPVGATGGRPGTDNTLDSDPVGADLRVCPDSAGTTDRPPVASASSRCKITNIYAYFANSFAAEPKDPAVIAAETNQDDDTFPSIVASRNIIAAQFHPEKSGDAGLALLKEIVQC